MIRLLRMVSKLLCVASLLYLASCAGQHDAALLPGANGPALQRSGKLSPHSASFSLIWNFVGNPLAYPSGPLLLDAANDAYGTTSSTLTSGNTCQCGSVFEIVSGGGAVDLYDFKGGADGNLPESGVIGDGSGALYGTTYEGGSSNCQYGCGTIFKLTPSGGAYTESVLYRFKGGTDGEQPEAGLALRNGVLYGTTTYGGAGSCTFGCGTIFSIGTSGSGYKRLSTSSWVGAATVLCRSLRRISIQMVTCTGPPLMAA